MSARQLAVVLYGHVIGHVTQRHRSAEPEFVYEGDYAATGRTPVSVLMPVADTSYRGIRVRAFLEGVLPEDPQTRGRSASQLAVEPDDQVGILSQVGWDCPGAVQFCDPDDIEEMLSRGGESARWPRRTLRSGCGIFARWPSRPGPCPGSIGHCRGSRRSSP